MLLCYVAINPEANQHHAKTKIAGFVRTRPEMEKLVGPLAARYQYDTYLPTISQLTTAPTDLLLLLNRYRPSGYTRVIRTRYRYGDHAPLAYIEYIDRFVVFSTSSELVVCLIDDIDNG
jgi:hypothetical protein